MVDIFLLGGVLFAGLQFYNLVKLPNMDVAHDCCERLCPCLCYYKFIYLSVILVRPVHSDVIVDGLCVC